MNTVTINNKTYQGVELYARLHNVSVSDVVEKAVLLLLEKLPVKQTLTETIEFREALAFVKAKAAKGGDAVPVDEDGLESLVETKYKL